MNDPTDPRYAYASPPSQQDPTADQRETRSFLFCTSYIHPEDADHSAERWRKWLRYYSGCYRRMGAERVFIIDDGTPRDDLALPAAVLPADGELPPTLPDGPVVWRFAEHLGRQSLCVFPGWWRSFSFASRLALKYAYDKVIHIESDAYVLSDRLMAYLRETTDGWTALWCPRYDRPESCIQIICRDSLRKLWAYHRAGPALWFKERGTRGFAEYMLPFTHVEKRFQGDRYGESRRDYPQTADFVCQARLEMMFDSEEAR